MGAHTTKAPVMDFTAEVETYTILILQLDEYKPTTRSLSREFQFCSPDQIQAFRAKERKILELLFDDWEFPYCRRMAGICDDSAVWVTSGKELVGGAWVCNRNEFDDHPERGQIHYAFMNRKFQGMGIYSVIFAEAVRRAKAWGLQELYLNSDRYMLPEVYLRWGARPLRVVAKRTRFGHNRVGRVLAPIYPWLRMCRRRAKQLWYNTFPPCD